MVRTGLRHLLARLSAPGAAVLGRGRQARVTSPRLSPPTVTGGSEPEVRCRCRCLWRWIRAGSPQCFPQVHTQSLVARSGHSAVARVNVLHVVSNPSAADPYDA